MKKHRAILLMFIAVICMAVVGCVHASAVEKENDDSRASDSVLFPVKVDGNWGYINAKGDILIEPKYDDADDFSEGLAGIKQKDKYGFINTYGNLIIATKYEGVGKFNHGIAVVKYNHRLGIIDKSGNFILEPEYQQIENIIVVCEECTENAFFTTLSMDDNTQLRIRSADKCTSKIYDFYEYSKCRKLTAKWGLIDLENDIFVKPIYNAILEFSEGMAGVGIGQTCGIDETDNSGRTGILSLYNNGERIGEPIEDCKWGFIDTTGKIVIAPRFNEIKSFKNGLAAVKTNAWWQIFSNFCVSCYWGFIDTTGKYQIQPQYLHVFSFEDDFTLVDDKNIFDDYARFKTVTSKGETVHINGFENVQYFIEGYFIAFHKGELELINYQGETILELKNYDEINLFDDEHFLVMKDGLKGLVRKSGKIIVDPIFKRIEPFTDGRAIVDKTNYGECVDFDSCEVGIGYIDKNGNIAVDLKYRNATGFLNGRAVVWDKDNTMVIDKFGKVIGEIDYKIWPIEEERQQSIYKYPDMPNKPYQPFKNGLMIFRLLENYNTSKFGVINSDGEILLPAEYDKIVVLEHGIIRLYLKNSVGYADNTGYIFWPLKN